jgi:hypothetical protein
VSYEWASETGIGTGISSGMENGIGTRALPKLYIYVKESCGHIGTGIDIDNNNGISDSIGSGHCSQAWKTKDLMIFSILQE